MRKRTIRVEDLKERIRRLPAKTARDLESKEALLRWLVANPKNRKARDWWDRLQLVPEMLWLATAAGETLARIRVAREAADSEWYISTRARIVRKFIPWEVLVEMLFRGRGL
jgi:hypothetical protein